MVIIGISEAWAKFVCSLKIQDGSVDLADFRPIGFTYPNSVVYKKHNNSDKRPSMRLMFVIEVNMPSDYASNSSSSHLLILISGGLLVCNSSNTAVVFSSRVMYSINMRSDIVWISHYSKWVLEHTIADKNLRPLSQFEGKLHEIQKINDLLFMINIIHRTWWKLVCRSESERKRPV